MLAINCDMGEAFSLYTIGDDEAMMPYITMANVACGFHASDPTVMRQTVQLAKRHNVKVGAHPSLPDLQGFGRREMKMEPDELRDCVMYQVGALKGFLDAEGMALSHIKPHGSLYGMAARDPAIAGAIADVVAVYGVPILGMGGTQHEEVYARQRGLTFLREFYVDREYDGNGSLIITRRHREWDPEEAAQRTLRAVTEGKVTTTAGTDMDISAECLCVHSDTADALAVARATFAAVKPHLAAA